jgi:hypothetical protein
MVQQRMQRFSKGCNGSAKDATVQQRVCGNRGSVSWPNEKRCCVSMGH